MRHKETKPADLQAICIVSLVCAVLFAGIAVTVLSEKRVASRWRRADARIACAACGKPHIADAVL